MPTKKTAPTRRARASKPAASTKTPAVLQTFGNGYSAERFEAHDAPTLKAATPADQEWGERLTAALATCSPQDRRDLTSDLADLLVNASYVSGDFITPKRAGDLFRAAARVTLRDNSWRRGTARAVRRHVTWLEHSQFLSALTRGRVTGRGETYTIRQSDDSLAQLGIFQGDALKFTRASRVETIRPGDLVAVRERGTGNLRAGLLYVTRDGRHVALHRGHPNAPLRIYAPRAISVLGVYARGIVAGGDEFGRWYGHAPEGD
jgi:hypothetical protein